MNTTPSIPESDSLDALHARNARHLCALFLGLADLGAEMVQRIAQRARDEAFAPASAATQLPQLVAAHDQMMRSLRRTALLIQRLTKPAPAANPAGQRADAARTPAGRRGGFSLHRAAPENLEKLSDAELEQLEALEPPYDIAARPLGETIGRILKDFGVAALDNVDHYTHLTPVEIGELCARAAAPPHGGCPADRPAGGDGAERLRPDGATGCRDP